MLGAVAKPLSSEEAMAPITTDAAHHTATAELDDLLASWRRHLVAQRMSPATLSTYTTSVRQLARFLAERGMPTVAAAITREHVEAFITDLLERWKPATAHNRYRALGSFFRWLVDEGEITVEPDGPDEAAAAARDAAAGPARGRPAPAARRLRGRQDVRRATRRGDPHACSWTPAAAAASCSG